MDESLARELIRRMDSWLSLSGIRSLVVDSPRVSPPPYHSMLTAYRIGLRDCFLILVHWFPWIRCIISTITTDRGLSRPADRMEVGSGADTRV